MDANVDGLAAALEGAIPKNLDDIIRLNRDLANLHLTTEAEIRPLTMPVAAQWPVTGEIDDWRLVTFDMPTQGKNQIFLLGNNGRNAWMTSLLTGIDLENRLVTTHSGSIYRLVGDTQGGEPPLEHLLHICATFHRWGKGPVLGVPHVFY